MDDGSKQGSGLHISVYAFSNADVDKLMFTLQDKFNLKCSIHYNRDNKPPIYIFVANFLVLMQLGAKHVESPFIEFGQISTVLYFAYFVLIVPVLSILENTLIDINTFQISIIRPNLAKIPKGKRYFHATKSL